MIQVNKNPYIILVAEKVKELKENVNHHIAQGYEPLGGVSCSEAISLNDNYCRQEVMFAQAMIKKTGLRLLLFKILK